MCNEKIPSKNLTYYIITLYHTTSTLLIQGSQRTVWVQREFPPLITLLNHHRNHCANNINEAYDHILEIPEEHQPTKQQQRTRLPVTPSASTDTSITPGNEAK